MSKSKHAKPDEFQKEQIRHLKKEIRRKDQEIRRLEKELGWTPEKKSTKKKIEEELPNCPSCGKGFLKEVEFAGRVFAICGICDFRKKL